MTLKIETSVLPRRVVFTLSGRMEAIHISELKELLALQPSDRRPVLDLKNIKLADREAVRFLSKCEAAGVTLQNCPAFIREWIAREDAEGGGERNGD